MTILYAQFNASTLKAIYDAAEDKVQIYLPAVCQDSGTYTLNFSDVIECSGANWPCDLNSLIDVQCTYAGRNTCGGDDIQFWEGSDSDWTFLVKCFVDLDVLIICAWCDDGIAFAASGVALDGSPASNLYTLAICNTAGSCTYLRDCSFPIRNINGRDGSCSFAWSA